MRFLFTTLQFRESRLLRRGSAPSSTRLGHDVAHVVFSRRAARRAAAPGLRAECLTDRMAALGADRRRRGARAARIVEGYGLPTLRDV